MKVKKVMIRNIWILILVSFTGCALIQKKVIFPDITYFIGSSDLVKYKRIAVLPFSDAPYAPQSGQIIQGLASQALAKLGFEVAERSRLRTLLQEQKMNALGISDIDQSIKFGKILGVSAIVVGEVGQYMTQQRKTDTTYSPSTNKRTGQITYNAKQGQQWMESYVSLTVRIIDVETGALIFSGSGQYNQGLTNPPQQLAEYILGHIFDKWGTGDGLTSLMNAAGKGQTKKVSELIKAGANVNAVTDGITALIMAAQAGHVEIVSLLVKAGADVNAGPVLSMAVLSGHTKIVSLLIKAGADVNARPVVGAAAIAGHAKIVSILIEAGADINTKDKNGTTALMHATNKGYTKIVNILKQAGAK